MSPLDFVTVRFVAKEPSLLLLSRKKSQMHEERKREDADIKQVIGKPS